MPVAVALADSYDRTIAALGRRQQEVGHLWAGGVKREKIAQLLAIAPATVQATVNAIYQTLGIHSREELRAKFAQGVRPTARSTRTLNELALHLALVDAGRRSPEEAEYLLGVWRTKRYAETRATYAQRAVAVLEFLEVLPAVEKLGSL